MREREMGVFTVQSTRVEYRVSLWKTGKISEFRLEREANKILTLQVSIIKVESWFLCQL